MRTRLDIQRDICREKKSYTSPQIAERGRTALRRKGRVGLAVYRCEVCRLWHLGHPSVKTLPPVRNKQRRGAA